MIEVNWICSKCNKGVVYFTGWTNEHPPKGHELVRHEHKCTKCGKTFMLMQIFPVLEYPWSVPREESKKLGITDKEIKKYT